MDGQLVQLRCPLVSFHLLDIAAHIPPASSKSSLSFVVQLVTLDDILLRRRAAGEARELEVDVDVETREMLLKMGVHLESGWSISFQVSNSICRLE